MAGDQAGLNRHPAMAEEIERKFLVASDGWRAAAGPGTEYLQGYLCADRAVSVRVRLAGGRAFLTIKGGAAGIRRSEFEYPLPPADARAIIDGLCPAGTVAKTRHLLAAGAHTWEIDVFHGPHAGLVLAEIELRHEDEPFERPDWLGPEVTGDPRYLNASLARQGANPG